MLFVKKNYVMTQFASDIKRAYKQSAKILKHIRINICKILSEYLGGTVVRWRLEI